MTSTFTYLYSHYKTHSLLDFKQTKKVSRAGLISFKKSVGCGKIRSVCMPKGVQHMNSQHCISHSINCDSSIDDPFSSEFPLLVLGANQMCHH